MKKAGILLLAITLTFSAFALGFFLGNGFGGGDVLISKHQIPTEADATNTTDPATVPAVVNINEATLEQLTTLPGIGPVLAQRVIDYRQENGPFAEPAELGNVSGIGEKRLEAILEYITVGG